MRYTLLKLAYYPPWCVGVVVACAVTVALFVWFSVVAGYRAVRPIGDGDES